LDSINHPKISTADITSLKGIFCGSAPLAVEVMNEFERLTGGRILEGYGMSETVNILTVTPVFTLRKPGSCGIVWPISIWWWLMSIGHPSHAPQ
jgi:long-chain acyl-CoA synthetase